MLKCINNKNKGQQKSLKSFYIHWNLADINDNEIGTEKYGLENVSTAI